MECKINSAADIPSEWVQGIHVGGRRARRQAVQVDHNGPLYLYPEDALSISDGVILRKYTLAESKYKKMGFLPHELPLPGTKEFKEAATITAEKINNQLQNQVSTSSIDIPRRCVMFSPSTLQATEEFEQAVLYALQMSDNYSKFSALQYVFQEFGYYYPYWIVLGGKFTHQAIENCSLSTWSIIMKVIREKLTWTAIGGDKSFLNDALGVKNWIESTSKYPELIKLLDVKPIYSLLNDSLSAEIERIYKAQQSYHGTYEVIHLNEGSPTTALVRLSEMHPRIGFTKGVHFGGSFSDNDAVQMINEADLGKLMKTACTDGKPRVECGVRRTMLGSSIEAHAFLHTEISEETEQHSGFVRGAISSYVEKNGGDLQPATRGINYFAMYIIHAEMTFDKEHIRVTDNLKTAIDKALRMNTSKEKYRELQKVFGSFGYYYPSVICLGGRALYKINSNDPPSAWMVDNGIATIDRAFKRITHVDDTYIETIGGSSMVTGCEDWINSIQTNRMRIQFKSMKPLYELLDDERRVQIQTIYDDHSEYADSFLELTKGIHFDGEEAVEQAVELAKKGTFSKLIMLKVFTSHTNMERVKRPASDGVDIKKYSKLDLESHHELPGNYGFISGSKAAYSERIKNHTQLVTKTKNPYNVAYVTYKEIHYYDEFVQPTEKFKKAIANALQADIEDNERYRALQDVFQRFGYYYPSAIRYGGRIAYEIYPAIEEKREIEGGGYDSTQKTHAATNNELIQQKTYHPEHSNDLIKVSSDLFRKCTPSDVEKTLKKSDCWEAVGGESHLLFCDGVESWIKTVESNQTLIQLKNLKPIYELLDSETRLSIQHIYENIIIQDQYICYNYSLAMTEFSVSAEGQDQKATIHISTEPLFELLLQKSFPDSKDAIDFCRNECEGFGFSIVEEEYTDKIICLYCSHSVMSKSKKTTNSHCLWGIALLMISEAEWKFQKLASPDESNHNHYLTDSGKKSSQRPRKNRQRSPSSDNTSESLIIKLVAERPVYSPEDPNAHYVKYGDVVRIRYLRRSNDEESANENTYIRASDVELPDGSRLGQGSDAVLEESDAKDLDEDFRWTVMPCLSDSNESTSDEGNQKNLHENDSSHNEIREQPQLGTTDTDKTAKVKRAQNSFAGCVRKGDVIVFESQRVVGGKKFYWRAIPDLDLDSMNLWKSGATFTCEEAGWQLQAINEYEASKAADNLDRVEVKDQNDVARYRLSADASGSHEYKFLMGHAYLYGLKGLDIDASEALKYLTAASKDGDLMAKHELGKLLWSRGEYENILELLKEAACLPVIETYRELGDIYHTGFSSQDNRFVVSKDRTKAFMYYLTGGILGDWRAALTAGEYLEKGYLEDFGRDTKTALRWYEYVARQGENSLGYVAAGKLKHELAVALTNQSEAEDLREDAYKSFESATLSEPYARFMIAVYHLKGWGHQEHNPTLGFQMLLSLAESGISMVLKAIAECYQHGVGVDRDHEKASTYRELAARMDEHKNIAGKNDP